MEVSSQALKLHRTQGFTFELGILTNISPDHIGPHEHASFEEYMYCKGLLFKQCKKGIVNCDDEHYKTVLEGHTCELETVMIDYAHNAMALESLLSTLKEYHPHRLIALFGCGGNRSKLRRYDMGEVSGKLADFTIITSDNPRFEEPMDIIHDIETGMKKTDGKYIEIPDRREAIYYALDHGEKGDIIVLAGKGHETYQEIKGKKYPMDEREIIKDYLKEHA